MTDEQIDGNSRYNLDDELTDVFDPVIIDGNGAWLSRTGYEFFHADAAAVGLMDDALLSLTEDEKSVLGGLIQDLYFARVLHFGTDNKVSDDLTEVFCSYPNLGMIPALEGTRHGEFAPLPAGFFSALEREFSALESLETPVDPVTFCGGAFDAELVAAPNGSTNELELSWAAHMRSGDSMKLTEALPLKWLDEMIEADTTDPARRAHQREEARLCRVAFTPVIGDDYDRLNSDAGILFVYISWRRGIMDSMRTYYTDPQYADMPLSWYLNLTTPQTLEPVIDEEECWGQ